MAYRRLSYSVVIIGLMLFAILPPALFVNHVEAPQPWWNTSWQYRKPITITSAASLSNYDVLVTTGTQSLVTAGKMKADGSDIRFVDSSNAVLSYWIESPTINTATTRLWVNVTSISSSGTTIWMYYGNSAATATSNGASTFSFFDDDWASITGPTGYNPVHTATQSWWEATCSYPSVFYDTSFSGRGPYQMLYDGHNGPPGNSKGYAYSPDLIHWTEYNGGTPHPPNPNPILAPGYTGNANCAWGDPIKVGSIYYLFYSAGPGTTYRAQSTDLITWTNLTPLNGSPSTISTGAAILKQGDGITPIVVDGKYWMIYFTAFAQGSMYLASSTDLLNWTPWSGNPLLSPTPNGFDALGLWTPSFVMLNNVYYIYYEAQNSTLGYITGYAKANAYNAGNPITPDVATWTKSSDAVLKHGPSGSWDSSYCIDPVIREFNGIYYLFYTGDSANGFATSSSPDGPWTKYNAPPSVGWTKGGSPTVSGGIVTLGSGSSLISGSTFGPLTPVALGYRANFGGSVQKLKWAGFIQGSANDRAMITTARTDTSLYLKNYHAAESAAVLSGVTLSNFHVYEVLWGGNAKSTGVVDHGAITATLTTQLPTVALPVTFYNFEDTTYSLQVDWVFARPYHDPEPTTSVGSEEQAPSNYTLTVTIVGQGSVNLNLTGPYSYGDVVQLTAVPAAGWSFQSWSGDLLGSANPTTLTITGNMVVTATFTRNTYTLSVSTVGSGSVTLNNSGPYYYGDAVKFTASPIIGWSFQSWSGGLVGSANPATLVIDSDKTVTATFTQDAYTLTISISGQGSVSKSPDQATYTWGTNVTLSATGSIGWAFSSWSGGASGTVNPVTVNITGNTGVTATFNQIPYTLTINVVGNGVVNLNNNGPYYYGNTVQLTAVAAAGWSFDHWSGDLSGSTTPTMLTITGNMAVTAYFMLPQLYVDPSSIQKGASDAYTTFQTSVMINKITDLKGFDFKLTWDNNLITLTHVDFNTSLDNVWGYGDWYLAYNVSGAGYYELAAVSTSTTFTSTAAMPLATLTFIVKAAVGQTSIHFAVVKLSDSQANSIQAEVTDGTYTVTGPQYQPVLQMTPGTVTCRKYHEYFAVQINVTNAVTMDGFSFTIYYSPTMMTYVSVSWGELGSGTITNVDQANGILEGHVAGTAISGNRLLLNVTFQDTATMIWKQGQVNEIDGQIWFHYTQLSFSGIQQLTYQEGGLAEISVHNIAFKFIPIQGDIDGDGIVDIFDMRAVAAYFDVKQGDPLWSAASAYDLNGNGVIDIYDLVLIGANFT